MSDVDGYDNKQSDYMHQLMCDLHVTGKFHPLMSSKGFQLFLLIPLFILFYFWRILKYNTHILDEKFKKNLKRKNHKHKHKYKIFCFDFTRNCRKMKHSTLLEAVDWCGDLGSIQHY